MKQKIFSLMLCLALLLSLTVPATAVEADAQKAAADRLYALGLFQGTGTKPSGTPDYALGRPLSRQEAVTMLVRLLGKEQEAKDSALPHPFSDVDDWAAPYVGYAYCNKLTNGISETTFGGSQPVTAAQYLTFVLRALDYVSSEDFTWNRAWEMTDALGLTVGQYSAANDASFLRGDAVLVSEKALSAIKKDGSATLLEQLVADGAVTPAEAIDDYTAFARTLLASEMEVHTVPVENRKIAFQHLEALVGPYDIYSSAGRIPAPDDPDRWEKLLVNTLEIYAAQCADGNYNDVLDRGPSMSAYPNSRFHNAYLLTDGAGTVIGYVLVDAGATEATVYTGKVDSRPLMDAKRAAFEAAFSQLTEVSATVTLENGQYRYQFTGLPEGAAKVNCLSHGEQPKQSALLAELYSYWEAGRTSGQELVNGCYTAPAEEGGGYRLFVFLDRDGTLTGYCLAVCDAESE